MYKKLTLSLIAVAGLLFPALSVNITGKITDTGGKAISGAIVKLSSKELSATTDASGNFLLKDETPVNASTGYINHEKIKIKNSIITIRLAKTEPVQIELFTAQGNLLKKYIGTPASVGDFSIDLNSDAFAENILLIRVKIGQNTTGFRHINSCKDNSVSTLVQAPDVSRITITQSAVDSLEVTASGYTAKTVKITSYETTVDITLDVASCKATPSNSVNTNVSGSGPHQVVVETNSDEGIKCGTIYRPKDIGPGKNYPVLVWGEGGVPRMGSQTRLRWERLLHGDILLSQMVHQVVMVAAKAGKMGSPL